MTNKTLFIAMPYGVRAGILDYSDKKAKSVTIDFDAVWGDMIRPAIPDNCKPLRADELRSAGLIDKQYIEKLFLADAVIADLTFGNPNVYYEIGMRHVFSQKGTVLVVQKGTRLPFDVRNQRVLEYDYFGATSLAKFQRELGLTIEEVCKQQEGSPVHALLRGLSIYHSPEGKDLLKEMEELKKKLKETQTKAAEDLLLNDLMNCNNEREAYRLYEEVLSRGFKSPIILKTLGIKLREYSRVYESKKIFEFATETHPEESVFYRELGFSYRKLGPRHYGEAEKNFTKALEKNPLDTELLGMLGGMYKRMDNYTKARDYYKKANEIVENIYASVNIAFIELVLNNKAESDKYYHHVIKLTTAQINTYSEDYWVYLTRGQALLVTGNFEGAMAAYQKATKLPIVPPPAALQSEYEQLQMLRQCDIPGEQIDAIVSAIFPEYKN